MSEDRADILIRVAELEDVDRITQLADSLGYSTSIKEMQLRLKRLISHSDHAIYVAQLLEEPVAGWIHVGISDTLVAGRQVAINGLIVQKNYRKLGIGHLLMQQAEAWGRLQACAVVLVRSNMIRPEAHCFYQHLGYSPLKTQLVLHKAL